MGGHHRRAAGQRVRALVVVGDHHVHPQALGVLRLVHGGDAAVHRDDKGNALPVQGIHCVPVQAVALLHPVGDVGNHRRALAAEKIGEQAGGGDPVHVIVPVDGDALVPLQRQTQAPGGLVHVQHQQRVVEQFLPAGQKGSGLFRSVLTPGAQSQGRQRGDARPLQGGARLAVTVCPVPLLIFHGRALSLPISQIKITLYYSKFRKG